MLFRSTKRALASIINDTFTSTPALLPFPRFASNSLHTCPLFWFVCKYVDGFDDLVFSHREDVSRKYLHTEITFAWPPMLVCLANGAMINLGHVINDLLLYHAHTCFAWSLLCVGINEWITTHNFMALDCASKECCRLDEVISFNLNAHVMNFKRWLLFECCAQRPQGSHRVSLGLVLGGARKDDSELLDRLHPLLPRPRS